MANSFGTETPPAPDPDTSNALMSGAPSSPVQGAMPQQPGTNGAASGQPHANGNGNGNGHPQRAKEKRRERRK